MLEPGLQILKNSEYSISLNPFFSVLVCDFSVFFIILNKSECFNSKNPFISVCQYVILIQTALTSDPGASEGQVSINIQGEYGDTGERKLSGRSPWKPGEEASFIIESVSLGALTKIKLQFEVQGTTI